MAGVNDAVQAHARPQRIHQQLVQLVIHKLTSLQDTHVLGQRTSACLPSMLSTTTELTRKSPSVREIC